MTTSIFLLVLFSAFCHAGWNLAARKAAGNLVVFWLGVWLGCGLLLPVVIVILIRDGLGQSFQAQAVVYIIATGVIHALYYVLLGAAYEHGEISVVYPVARGSGIALTATLAWLLLKEGITVLGSIGIGLICVGVLSMSLSGNNMPGPNPPGGKKGNEKALLSALGVGVTIVAYSLIDKVGVGYVNPIIYIWSMWALSGLLLSPFVLWRYSGEVNRIIKGNIKFSGCVPEDQRKLDKRM